MGRHIIDTQTMHWEIYYVYPQSGRTCYVAASRPAAAAVRSSENLQTNIDR